MEYYVNPAKEINSEDYWISAKRPKVMAALRRAFPRAEWDVLSTTIDAQIDKDHKQHPAKWLNKLSQHYLGDEPIMQRTHNFLRILKQEPGRSIQDVAVHLIVLALTALPQTISVMVVEKEAIGSKYAEPPRSKLFQSKHHPWNLSHKYLT